LLLLFFFWAAFGSYCLLYYIHAISHQNEALCSQIPFNMFLLLFFFWAAFGQRSWATVGPGEFCRSEQGQVITRADTGQAETLRGPGSTCRNSTERIAFLSGTVNFCICILLNNNDKDGIADAMNPSHPKYLKWTFFQFGQNHSSYLGKISKYEVTECQTVVYRSWSNDRDVLANLGLHWLYRYKGK
jgi:hypothetical protein